jgi:hypothetical protein
MHQIYLAARLYESDFGGLPLGSTDPGFKPYYSTILYCPDSKLKNQPAMRSADYTYLGEVAPWEKVGVEKCKEIRGQSFPLIFDENHDVSYITPEDTVSKFLVVRLDGSFEAVLATKVYYGPVTCSEPKISSFYNL